jgi:Rrf2 family protein
MRVTQRLDYALRALVLLAAQPPGTHTAAGQLADDLGLPRRVVEQQISELARAGIVESRRGARGGCALARPADQITVRDVVDALQGVTLDVPHVSGSAVSEMWAGAAKAFSSHLGSVSIADLSVRQRALDAGAAPMYYI